MSEEILLKFFEVNLIDLKGDDTKLEKLRATAKVLSAGVKKSPNKAIPFTMAAADSTIAADDPSIDEAMTALKVEWETVSNLFNSRPLVLLRALLLDAVVQASRTSENVALAFVSSAHNALPYVESSDEGPIWLAAVKEIEALVDARAEAEWATPEQISVPPLEFEAPKIKQEGLPVIALDGTALGEKFANSFNGFQQHPGNNFPAWGQYFAARMSAAIEQEFGTAFKQLKLSPVDLSAPMTALSSAMSSHIAKTLQAFSGATAGLQRRTSLLWWKEALYSPSAQSSYRDMPVFQASALMALDLYSQVPMFSPASVAAFLKESIRLLPVEDGSKTKTAFSLLIEARTQAMLEPLRNVAAQLAPQPTGRGPLLSLLGHVSESAGLDETKLRALVGIPSNTEFTPEGWGTYLFRELQAARAVTSTTPKRTRSKD